MYDGLQKKTSDVFKVLTINNECIDSINILKSINYAFQPKPVVDNIKSEAEIFGNTGDQLKPLSNLVVSTMSVVSDLVNKIVDVSEIAAKNITYTLMAFINLPHELTRCFFPSFL